MLQEGNLRPTATILNTSDGERQDSLVVQFTDRYKDAYRNEMDHFIDVIAGNSQFRKVTIYDVNPK